MTGTYWTVTGAPVRRFQVAHGIRTPARWAADLAKGCGQGRPAPPAAGPAPAAGPHPAAGRAPAARPAGVVYLTLDDGPTPAYTPRVLALLARHRAGRRSSSSAATRHLAGAGRGARGRPRGRQPQPEPPCLTGLRGWAAPGRGGAASQPSAGPPGPARAAAPAYGTVDAASAYRVRGLGLRLVLWDVDSNDWRRPGAGVIAGRVLSRVRSGDVVLFHDGGGNREQTVAALGQVLSALSARGFRFSALCRG